MIKENLLDGRMFFYLFYSGGKKVLEYQQEINKINVFPVPDADTGTNLASTVRSVMEMISPDQSFKSITSSIAEAALIGARGNSGVIFAQFLNGINEQTCDCHAISLKEFAITLKNSVKYLYEAIADPVEGTMLTVIREWSEFMYKHKDALDFRTVFIKSLEAAEKSLRETPEKLKALAKFNVVDAGAKGFVVFLQGILEFLKHQNIKSLLSAHRSIEIVEDIPELSHEKFNYRFCTEALIRGENLDQKEIESIIHSFGDSAVMAGTKKLTRIHVHTDHPDRLMDELRHTGTLTYQKADDMMMQYAAAHERKWNIALVTDSVCDLPDEIMKEYQIHMVPLNLFFGENQYIDKVTITPEKFYHVMEECEDLPSTSQPSVKSFVNLYSQLLTNYDSVISVHLSEHLSGTLNGAQNAAEKVSEETGKRISVLDTKTLSGSEGLLVYRTALEIANGKTHDEVLQAWGKWSENTQVLVSVRNMKNLAKSGRVSLLKGLLAKALGIKPIIAVNKEGKTYLMDKTLTQKGNMKRVMKHLKVLITKGKVWQYVVLHANNDEGAKWFVSQMKDLSGHEPFAVINSSPVVGAHLGNKTVAVAFMYE
jgi:DegV family protein with EDD domain